MTDSNRVRRIKVYTGTFVIGALLGLGSRLLLVGNHVPGSTYSLIAAFIFGFGAAMTVTFWYRPARFRAVLIFLGIMLMTSAIMWFVPFPA